MVRRQNGSISKRRTSEPLLSSLAACLPLNSGTIEGSPVVVRSDHESLKHVLTQRNLGCRLTRFVDDISHFDLHIIYHPGHSQLAADALSRRDELPPTSDAAGYQPRSIHATELEAEETEADRTKLFSSTFGTLARYRKELTDGANPSTIGTGKYFVEKGVLFKNTNPDDEEGGDDTIMVVPTSLPEAENIIRALHNDLGHLGELVERTLCACNPCQFTRREPSIPQTLHPLPRVDISDIWAFDFVGPLRCGSSPSFRRICDILTPSTHISTCPKFPSTHENSSPPYLTISSTNQRAS